jgi:hypothetical protein
MPSIDNTGRVPVSQYQMIRCLLWALARDANLGIQGMHASAGSRAPHWPWIISYISRVESEELHWILGNAEMWGSAERRVNEQSIGHTCQRWFEL